MRIGIVCYPTLGGSGVVATELAHALASMGHMIHLIAYDIPFRLKQECPNIVFHQVDINRYDLFQYPDYALPLSVKMAEVAKKENLEIFHVHYAIPHATSAYLARQMLGSNSPKIVTTLHGTDITLVGKDPSFFDIVKFSIEKSDAVTCVSNHLKEETYIHFHVNKKIEVIPNFFVPKKALFGRKPMRSCFAKSDEKLLIHASNFRSVKRIEDVIAIFEKVQREIPAKLLLLGSGPQVELAFELVQQKSLTHSVLFLGLSTQVDPYIASSDLFLLPSSQESFGLSALEAMGYGVPVIATNVGGIPEVVEDGATGFLSPLGDVDKMSRDAIRLLKDEALYQRFSHEAMKLAATRFSLANVLPLYLDVYHSCLQTSLS